MRISVEKFEYQDVVDYRIKGIWYFDKRIGELRYDQLLYVQLSRFQRERY